MFVVGSMLFYGSLCTKIFMESNFPGGVWVGGGICDGDN